MYQDFSTCHDWPVKNAIVDLPIRMKVNSKHRSCNSLSLLGGAELTKVKYICDAFYLVIDCRRF